MNSQKRFLIAVSGSIYLFVVQKPNITKIKKRQLNQSEEELVVEIIVELVKTKLSRENVPAHSGIWNSVIVGDSSLIIEDFPSNYIVNFGKLRDAIINE